MNDFFKAAFPWIVIGLAIAILAASHVSEKKKSGQSKDAARGSRLSEGMCIGMSMGVVLGTSGVCELGTGICLGMLIGEVIGLCIKK